MQSIVAEMGLRGSEGLSDAGGPIGAMPRCVGVSEAPVSVSKPVNCCRLLGECRHRRAVRTATNLFEARCGTMDIITRPVSMHRLQVKSLTAVQDGPKSRVSYMLPHL
jgi:hypothetical protein